MIDMILVFYVFEGGIPDWMIYLIVIGVISMPFNLIKRAIEMDKKKKK